MIVIKKPIVTEKSIEAYKNANKVTFEVALSATKDSAKSMLEKVYGVTVTDVKVSNRLGKTKLNFKTGRPIRRSANKKIMVFTLKKGDKIDVFNQ